MTEEHRKRFICPRCQQLRAPYKDGICKSCTAPHMVTPMLGRIEDYAELRHERRYTVALAAQRVGVSQRTAERYEAKLKEGVVLR